MKLYTFTHFMLAPMAKGIQALHSTTEMFVKYPQNFDLTVQSWETQKSDYLYDWAKNYKTCVSLNGGVSPDLTDLHDFFCDRQNPYPWAPFYEDESLGNLMTSISIVLPERIYLLREFMRKYKTINLLDDGYVLILESDMEDIEDEVLEKIASFPQYNDFEVQLVRIIGEYKLAS